MMNVIGYVSHRAFFLLLVLVCLSSRLLAANTVTGIVYGAKNDPLVDVDVELLNDLSVVLQRVRTDSGGRYSFNGLPDGRYAVRVMPFRYDLQEGLKEIIFSTFRVRGGTGSTAEILDFNLMPRKFNRTSSEARVVFVQDVPDGARIAWNRAENALKRNDQIERLAALEEAIKLFPTFFDALQSLGEIFFAKQDYGKAAHYFLRAVDINNKSQKSLYLLGYSLYMLHLFPSAGVALNQALNLDRASAEVLLLLGTTEIREGKLAEAEKHLLEVRRVSTTPNPEVFWQLSQLYGNHLKKFSEAADELEKYMRALPSVATTEQKKKIEDYKKIVDQLRKKAKSVSKP